MTVRDSGPLVLFLHHRYRTAGGEEQAVENLAWLVRERLGEDAELLERASGTVTRARAAAGMLAGGLDPHAVADAVRRTGARIVHAHNLHPTLGWRALAAARSAGAAVVLHVHQYRLVCAIGVCFRDGHECTRCHGRNTLPGIRLNCRGSVPEAIAYGIGLAAWQQRLARHVDAFVVPSRFAGTRLRAIGAPVGPTFVVPHVIREFAAAPAPGAADSTTADAAGDRPALVVSRLSPEKGVTVAAAACRLASTPLVIAGEGPERERLADSGATLLGRVPPAQLAQLRQVASVAIVPSLSAETFGLAAAEAMAAGLPVAASNVGALPELVPGEWLSPPGDPDALAETIRRLRGDPNAGAEAIRRVRAVTAPDVVAPRLAEVYAHVTARPTRTPTR